MKTTLKVEKVNRGEFFYDKMDNDKDIEAPISWLEWFLTRESALKINIEGKRELFQTFESSRNEFHMKAQLMRYHETVFLFKQNFGINKLNLFHHLSSVGGNFYNLQEHFGAIQGLDEDVTSVVTPEISELLDVSTNTVQVPSIEEYMKITSTEELKDLRVTKDVSYKARNFIPVPPFMLHDLNQAILDYDGDSKEVLLVAIQVIQEFDKHMKDEGLDQSETARDSCVEILHWLYLAMKGKMNSIPTVACSVREVRKHFLHVQRVLGHEKIVEKSPNEAPSFDSDTFAKSIQKPLEIIAASSSSTQDFLSKLTQIQSTNQDKSPNSFGKMSDRVQNMFFVASSRGNVVPTTLNDEANLFFKSSNFSKAQQYLEHYLEAKGIECAIPTAVANLWLQGCFLWLNPLTPSGFATSVISSKDVIFNDSLHEGIMLDFSTKHEISKASLTKLTKTQVIYPTSIELMVERVEAITVFANLFFTEKSYLTKGLDHLLTLCKSNRTLLRTKLYMDKMFIAKFLFSIDDRINKWLSECGKNDIVEKTSMELVDFATIISDLKLNRYYCDLPQSIKTVARNDDELTDSVTPKDKKRKTSGESIQLSRKTMKDESINPEWRLKDGESWQTWRHRVNNAPTLSCSAKPCLKFHVKGTCFDDCANRKSHRKLTGEDFKKTDEFIKKVRQDMK